MFAGRSVASGQSRLSSVDLIDCELRGDDDWESQQLLYPEPEPTTSINQASSVPARCSSDSASASRPALRRRPKHHIPRPPNSFICFRMDYCVLNKRSPSGGVRDHRLVSKMAAQAWKALNPALRAQYAQLAEQKKKQHAAAYPGYTYVSTPRTPGTGKGKKRKAVDDEGDYGEPVPQAKKRKAQAAAGAQRSDVAMVTTPRPSRLALAASPSATPSPTFSDRVQTPELSPNASESESPVSDLEPVLYTPFTVASPFCPASDFDDFVPTADIPPLDLYAMEPGPEKKDQNLIASQTLRPSSSFAVGEQFFKAEIPRETRDLCMWYPGPFTADGYYTEPSTPAFSAAAIAGAGETTFTIEPPPFDSEIRFTNPFALAGLGSMQGLDVSVDSSVIFKEDLYVG
ncbi:hypothetical protein GGX14DRAFT_642294 [Mycena pura]|uniref:HMG box domain-containing protein n=1 Tax=Mycena pura TaxID=153505 RepID=A0AAD6YQ66_9AGAR|nr:hypothetical protein GGX14DRAFT_642294 [Mycena pura]